MAAQREFSDNVSGCQFPKYKGDGYCDDGNNNAGCSFDEGDCCGDDVITDFCNVCECLQKVGD